jgi:hypothetical protein
MRVKRVEPPPLRGGSWINNNRNARCANRNRNIPDNYNNNVGFRLVVSIAVLCVSYGTSLVVRVFNVTVTLQA